MLNLLYLYPFPLLFFSPLKKTLSTRTYFANPLDHQPDHCFHRPRHHILKHRLPEKTLLFSGNYLFPFLYRYVRQGTWVKFCAYLNISVAFISIWELPVLLFDLLICIPAYASFLSELLHKLFPHMIPLLWAPDFLSWASNPECPAPNLCAFSEPDGWVQGRQVPGKQQCDLWIFMALHHQIPIHLCCSLPVLDSFCSLFNPRSSPRTLSSFILPQGQFLSHSEVRNPKSQDWNSYCQGKKLTSRDSKPSSQHRNPNCRKSNTTHWYSPTDQ